MGRALLNPFSKRVKTFSFCRPLPEISGKVEILGNQDTGSELKKQISKSSQILCGYPKGGRIKVSKEVSCYNYLVEDKEPKTLVEK